MSAYRLSIVRTDGGEVRMRPGREGNELDLIERVIDRMHEQGVGMLRSSARVESALRTAFDEVFTELKKRVQP